MKTSLLRLLAILGIVANVAFLVINLYPDRPRFGKRRSMKILLRTDEARKKWLDENMFEEFGATADVDVEVILAKSYDEVIAILEKEKQQPTGLTLAVIDDSRVDEAIGKGLVKAFADTTRPGASRDWEEDYLPEALAQGRDGKGKQWFLPRRAQIDIAVYLRPAVEEAYVNWEVDRKAIEAALAEANGVGLPKGYSLKRSPDSWNTYDLFVAAWYWAHHPASWTMTSSQKLNGAVRTPGANEKERPTLPTISPRIASQSGEAFLRDLIGAFFRQGLGKDELGKDELGKPDAAPIIDAMQWAVLFRKHNLMLDIPAGDGPDHLALFRERQLAWVPINQEDTFWLHGGTERDAARGMRGSRDLGWSLRPAGVSVELKDGAPARKGKSFSFLEVQLWALPEQGKTPELAYRLVRHMLRRALHQREAEAQGILPVRKDIQQNYSILFRLEWMQRVLDASYRQIRRGSGHMPDDIVRAGTDDRFLKVYHAVTAGAAASLPVTYEAVRKKVLEVPK